MKKLLSSSSSATEKRSGASFHGVMPGAPQPPQSQQSPRLPWLSGLSSSLKEKQQEAVADSNDDRGLDDEGYEIVPREPEAPRPSGAVSTAQSTSQRLNPPVKLKKGIQFHAYKSTRPDLLSDLTKLVGEGLLNIQRNYPHLFSVDESEHVKTKATDSPSKKESTPRYPPSNSAREEDASLYSAERLRVYASAFQRYIDESTIYQHFLQETKDVYDAYVLELLEKMSSFTNNVQQKSNRELELVRQLGESEEAHRVSTAKYNDKIKDMELQLIKKDLERAQIEADCKKSKDLLIAMKKEYDELKGTCVTLTNGLSRMEEEHRIHQNNETSRMTELTYLRVSEQKLNEEIEKLQQVLQNMEQIQASMVSQDVVTNLEATLEGLRGEFKRLETTHRQLLQRYATLKVTVDDAFKQFEKDCPKGAFVDIRGQVNKIIEESLSKRASKSRKDMLKDPVAKIMAMMESGSSPRLIVEVLLDQVASAPNRRQNYAALLEIEKEFPVVSSLNAASDSATNKVGTVAFEGENGIAPFAEEFRSPWSHFDGLGYDESIPSYLRFHGKIQNLYLSKREITIILQEIWEAKFAYDKSHMNQAQLEAASLEASESANPSKKFNNTQLASSQVSPTLVAMLPINPSMATFFECYLLDKYSKNQMLACEMAYNVVDALKRFSAVSDCRMFSLVLEDKMPMEIWIDQKLLVDRVRDEIVREVKVLKASNNGDGSGDDKITADQLIRFLRRMLVTKTENAFSKLSKAISMDSQGGRFLNALELMIDDHFKPRSHFLEQLKMQHINEAVSFEKHVLECISQFADRGELDMTVTRFRDAICYADSNKSRADVNKLLSRGCGTTVEDMLLMEAKRVPVNIEGFKKKLRSGLIHKSPPAQGKRG